MIDHVVQEHKLTDLALASLKEDSAERRLYFSMSQKKYHSRYMIVSNIVYSAIIIGVLIFQVYMFYID